MTVYKRELRENLKALLIWSLTVGGLGFFCIILYSGMSGDIEAMADSFSNMGAFSDAFGMSTLSIGTLSGYFATEVGTIHGLGSGLYAALLFAGLLSKEEDGHTGEFLYSLPLSRGRIVTEKLLSGVTCVFLFTLVCALFYVAGYACLSEEIPCSEFLKFLFMEFFMNIEIAALCFMVSSFGKRKQVGTGLGIALILYVFDLIGRVVPDLKDYLFLGPYSFANASEIFAGFETDMAAVILGGAVTAAVLGVSYYIYTGKDLAA